MVVELNPKVEEAVERTWLTSMLSAEKAKEDAIVASPLNVTKVVSVLVAMFAVIAQLLAATGTISLSTTQQVTIWLVAAGLIVLLSIADMTCRAHVTAKWYEYSTAVQTRRSFSAERVRQRFEETEPPVRSKPGDAEDRNGAGVSPNGAEPAQHHAGASRNGPRRTVSMADVFPYGCELEPDSISEAKDYDEAIETRPVVDKRTGKRVYQCRVVDLSPGLNGNSPERRTVKIVAGHMPLSPNGTRFEPVEFEGLTAVLDPIGPGQVGYSSLRATGFRPATVRAAGQENTAP